MHLKYILTVLFITVSAEKKGI